MRSFLTQHGLRLFGLLLAAYLVFIMELGGHTFAGHVVLILKTDESRELGRQIVAKLSSVASGAKHRAELAFSSDSE